MASVIAPIKAGISIRISFATSVLIIAPSLNRFQTPKPCFQKWSRRSLTTFEKVFAVHAQDDAAMSTASSISVTKKALACLLREGRMVVRDEITFAWQCFNHPLGFQLRVSLRNCIAIDAQFCGERAKRRKGIAGPKFARSGRIADLIGQLQIDRFARLKIDLKNHIPSAVIQHYDSWSNNVKRENCAFLTSQTLQRKKCFSLATPLLCWEARPSRSPSLRELNGSLCWTVGYDVDKTRILNARRRFKDNLNHRKKRRFTANEARQP